jgi:myo-inositol-1(or 4)-monophosphatase
MDLLNLALQVEALCRKTGEYITEQAKAFKTKNIEYKGKNDMVSYVDKTAEELLVKGLSELLPEAGFLTEENTVQTEQLAYTWIIDPLDGTTNFIHGLPIYAISIGLEHNNEIVLGVVYEINKDEMFRATKNGGAFLNGTKIFCTATKDLKDTLLATGFPYYNFEQLTEYMKLFSVLMQETHGLRRLGSAAVDLAYVACGRFDGYFEYNLNAWDVAGGTLLVQEAGGKCIDFKGGDDFVHGRSLIVGNESICHAMLSHAKQCGF